MDRVLYVAMSGAKQTGLAQAANNNNLANISTTGFVRDLNQFRSMQAFGVGYPSRVYAMSEKPSLDFDKGAIVTTGRSLDIAVDGEGWIAVQARDGTEAYTRAGDLKLDANGMLRTGTGLPVLGNGGAIILPPSESVSIGGDGTLSLKIPGQDGLVALDRIRIVTADTKDLIKGYDGLIRHRDGLALQPNASLKVVSGALERSNVNMVEAMVDMIQLSRSYETQVKMMKRAEEMDSATDNMLRMS